MENRFYNYAGMTTDDELTTEHKEGDEYGIVNVV